MNGKALFACSKCFSRHPFEDLSAGQQICKKCRGEKVLQKCCFCRSEYYPEHHKCLACKKCEYNLTKYGKPKGCELCKIGAAFAGSKCMRCANYEEKYGPPVQCDECKQRSAFDKRDENKKYNGKLLCWLCSCAFKRALIKANEEIRNLPKGKRTHDHSATCSTSYRKESNSDGSTIIPPTKKSLRNSEKQRSKSNHGNNIASSSNGNNANVDLAEKVPRTLGNNAGGNSSSNNPNNNSSCSSTSNGNGNGVMSMSSIMAAPVITIDPNSADHVVAMTNLKERIASLEKRLQMKDRELLEKDKLITELRGENFGKELEMRAKLREIDRLHDMKVENLNRKVTSLLREIATLKKDQKKHHRKHHKNNRIDLASDASLDVPLTRDQDFNNDDNNEQQNNDNNQIDITDKKDEQKQQEQQQQEQEQQQQVIQQNDDNDDDIGSSSTSDNELNN